MKSYTFVNKAKFTEMYACVYHMYTKQTFMQYMIWFSMILCTNGTSQKMENSLYIKFYNLGIFQVYCFLHISSLDQGSEMSHGVLMCQK